ncbi:MAG: hypothetical protein LH679_12025, partial [Cyanobacteria bacterium CAN_BIN43]|nr:hypothetical protein [Cyanobacteria bacterium CAN_BIN43]
HWCKISVAPSPVADFSLLRFAQPLPCFRGVSQIEVSDRHFCKRLAERCHTLLPFGLFGTPLCA